MNRVAVVTVFALAGLLSACPDKTVTTSEPTAQPAPPPVPPAPAASPSKPTTTGSAPASTPTPAPATPKVADFEKLDDKGFVESFIKGEVYDGDSGSKSEALLESGRYRLRDGKLVQKNRKHDRLWIGGSGRENTLIEGDLVIEGDGHRLSNFTLKGSLVLHGNDCTVDIDVLGTKDVSGTNNTVK